jgi:hypothetical protein
MDNPSMHNTLILLHAATATLAFFAGCALILSPRYMLNRQVFNLYLWSLLAMALLLAAAVVVYWEEYSDVERIIFPGLLGLALFILFRAWGAGLVLATQQENWKLGYVEHIGFTLVSLLEGFIIVSGLNSGFAGWLVAVIAILGLLAGRWLIGFAKRRVA